MQLVIARSERSERRGSLLIVFLETRLLRHCVSRNDIQYCEPVNLYLVWGYGDVQAFFHLFLK